MNEGGAEERLIYCLYARKSSESDERQAMSIDSQVKEMKALTKKEGLFIKEVRSESYSAKASGERPVFSQMIEDIKQIQCHTYLGTGQVI